MQTTRGVGSLATHPIAAKRFEEVGAASIICFYGSVCRHPRAVEPVLSLALGTAKEPPAPEPVLIPEQGKVSYERKCAAEDVGWWTTQSCGTRATHEKIAELVRSLANPVRPQLRA